MGPVDVVINIVRRPEEANRDSLLCGRSGVEVITHEVREARLCVLPSLHGPRGLHVFVCGGGTTVVPLIFRWVENI